MRRHRRGPATVTPIGPLLAAVLLLSGCASGSEREWKVAADPRATAADIIEAGHAVDIATGEDQMVVTWEVQPEDDEGPYQGAWRLYDRDMGAVADGTFGSVRESSARIDVVTVRDGFLLTDYVKHVRYILDVEGRLVPARLAEAKLGTSLVGGELLGGRSDGNDAGWSVLLPGQHVVVRLTGLPTPDVQGIELTSDGTVWVLLPWTSDGSSYRIAHAKNGKPPWTTETIPLPKGSGVQGEGMSASGDRLFVVASRTKGDRLAVDAVLTRAAEGTGVWERIDATGIPDNLTSTPHIEVLPRGRLGALSEGEGAWIQKDRDSGFTELRVPGQADRATPRVFTAGRWLWSSEQGDRNGLRYSYDGNIWTTFDR